MFLQLAHTRLDVFQASKKFVLECYKITMLFPHDEKFAMKQQVRRAALSVHLNIAEGCSRKSNAERRRYFEMARGSIIEVDTALDIAYSLNYCSEEIISELGEQLIKIFKLLCGLMGSGLPHTHHSPLTTHDS